MSLFSSSKLNVEIDLNHWPIRIKYFVTCHYTYQRKKYKPSFNIDRCSISNLYLNAMINDNYIMMEFLIPEYFFKLPFDKIYKLFNGSLMVYLRWIEVCTFVAQRWFPSIVGSYAEWQRNIFLKVCNCLPHNLTFRFSKILFKFFCSCIDLKD